MVTRPESVGLSSSRLETMDRFIKERYLDSGKLPGALTLIARRDEVAHLSVQGFADVERNKPLSEDTLFRIYSMTKPITSVAFMMLVEQGLVALDDPVHRFIPEWRDLAVYDAGFMETFRTHRPKRPMLMVDLLRHTSGLTYGFQQRTNVDAAYRKLKLGEIEKFGTLDYMVEKLAGVPLEFSPGDAWNYSVSTDILGYLVGKISGMPFEKYLKARVFEPLKMHDTDFSVPGKKAERFAACYAVTAQGRVLYDDPTKSHYLKAPTMISGGGGLVSTVGDYLRFCRMLINGGELDGARLLSPKTIQLMTANHLPGAKDLSEMSISLFSEANYSGIGFGLGFSVTLDPARSLIPGTPGDFSWGGAASTYFWIDPKEELIAIFMTQLMPSTHYPVRREFRTLVYSAFTEANR
jgi:CubicO group peptidase (beta-lactamase class C family)